MIEMLKRWKSTRKSPQCTGNALSITGKNIGNLISNLTIASNHLIIAKPAFKQFVKQQILDGFGIFIKRAMHGQKKNTFATNAPNQNIVQCQNTEKPRNMLIINGQCTCNAHAKSVQCVVLKFTDFYQTIPQNNEKRLMRFVDLRTLSSLAFNFLKQTMQPTLICFNRINLPLSLRYKLEFETSKLTLKTSKLI